MEEKEIKVVDTDNKGEHGENRCPQCGASDVTYNIQKKKLICNYCYTEFEAEEVEGIEKEAKNLEGETRASGTKDIDQNASDVITLKCGGCGAEVVINTAEATNARCHWCRSILSVNSQIENGAIPDVVLPFQLSKEEAQKNIEKFVSARKFYANSTFKNEFTTKNIMGVYFPYMLVDAKGHGDFKGEGGHVARSYKIKVGKDSNGKDKEETVYDIDIYNVERSFDIAIDDLSIESSKDKLNKNSKEKTTNVINSIMPFDTENCVKYKANYLAGFTSEKRDVNISNIEGKVDQELKDVARHAINKDLTHYDSGVEWKQEDFKISGKQWVSAYLPVWLYSYQDAKKVLHYVAVNGRTGETMGSIPMNKTKLVLLSVLIFLAFFIASIVAGKGQEIVVPIDILGIIIAVVYYFSKCSKYRNKGARHKYELETKSNITNIVRKDEKLRTETECSSSYLSGANNTKIEGEYTSLSE